MAEHFSSDNSLDDSSFDEERESQILAQIEAERTANPAAPTGLFILMLAPLLLIAFPLMLLWFLRSSPSPNTTAAPQAPQAPLTLSQTAPVKGATAIAWQTSLDEALAQAQRSGKPIMADFYATWCGPCKMLDEQTWVDPSVIQQAQSVITVKVDVDANAAAAQRYRIGPIPCVVWMDANGNEKGRSVGAIGPQEMLSLMQKYH